MRLILALALTAFYGCGDDDGSDAGSDASRDAGSDSGRDGGGDTGTDGGVDAPADTGFDAGEPARRRLMYVSVGSESRLAVVELGATGAMTELMSLSMPAGPGAMTFARRARRLYVGAGGNIVTIDLDASGTPTITGQTPGTGNPVYLSVAHDDSVLVSAYFGDDRLKTHDISGAPPHAETASLAVGDEPHAALIGPTGARVYVPHRNGNRTQWFDLGTDGALSLGGELLAADGVGPRHIIFSPDGGSAWIVNEFDDSVTAHSVAADGSLTPAETVTTLPAGFDGDMNTCADIHITPDGRYVYASNRGHDSLAVFDVEGGLTARGQVSTEARPREFDLSPDGRFVVAAGQDSGFLQSYRIEADGALTMVDRLDVGNGLRWVIIE